MTTTDVLIVLKLNQFDKEVLVRISLSTQVGTLASDCSEITMEQ